MQKSVICCKPWIVHWVFLHLGTHWNVDLHHLITTWTCTRSQCKSADMRFHMFDVFIICFDCNSHNIPWVVAALYLRWGEGTRSFRPRWCRRWTTSREWRMKRSTRKKPDCGQMQILPRSMHYQSYLLDFIVMVCNPGAYMASTWRAKTRRACCPIFQELLRTKVSCPAFELNSCAHSCRYIICTGSWWSDRHQRSDILCRSAWRFLHGNSQWGLVFTQVWIHVAWAVRFINRCGIMQCQRSLERKTEALVWSRSSMQREVRAISSSKGVDIFNLK